MIDIQGILKLEGKYEERFTNLVNGFIRNGRVGITSTEDAIASLAEILKGKQGISISTQIGLDNEMGLDVLFDTWKDETERVLTSPLYDILMKPLQIVTDEKNVPGPNATISKIKTIKIVALIKIKDGNGFYNWSDYATDVMIGQVKGEGINQRKLAHLVRDKVYAVQASSRRPETMFPFFEVDDRCINANEITHTFPSFMEVSRKVYGEPIPLAETPNHISDDNFDVKLIRGRVETIKLPTGNDKSGKEKNTVTLNLGDSSISIDDIDTNKFGAYLRVLTNINILTSQSFGQKSYIYVLSKLQKATPRPGFDDDSIAGLGVVAWFPVLIYPILRQGQESLPSASQPVDAGGVNALAKIGAEKAGKGIPPAITSRPITPPVTTPPTSMPAPRSPAPSTDVGRSIDVEARLAECSSFGGMDMGNPGCEDCMKTSLETYKDCKSYTKK